MRSAPPVGIGVPRTKRSETPLHLPGVATDPGYKSAYITGDGWSDTPTIKDQLRDPELWRVEREEVRVFDLSDHKQLTDYNELLTKTSNANSCVFIKESKTEKFDDTNNWKALLHLVHVKFRVILESKTK